MFGREQFQILTGIEAENLLFGCFGAVVTAKHRERRVALGIFPPPNLYGCAAAVPTVRRQIERPERVGGRQRCAVQNCVIFSHTVILSRAVLEVVTVAVGFNLLPACSH